MSANLTDKEKNGPRSFEELQECGFLWLINTTVFHPRGYALAFHVRDFDGKVTGWSLQGDGTERWVFVEDPDKWPEGKSPDDAFDAVNREFDRQSGELRRGK